MFKLICFIILTCFFFSSCSITERVSYGDSEGVVPEGVIKNITSKKAEKPWVIANLGQPLSVDKLYSHTGNRGQDYEVYNYRFTKSHVRSGHLLFILKAGGKEESVEYFHVAFEGMIIEKAWTDRLPRAQLGERVLKQQKQVAKASVSKPDIVDNENRFAWKLPILKKWFSKPAKKQPQIDITTHGEKDGNATVQEGTIKSKGEMTSTESLVPSGSPMEKQSTASSMVESNNK